MNVIITGATSGIGWHTALALAGNPQTKKILATGRNLYRLDELKKHGRGKIETLPLDLKEDAVENLAVRAGDFFGFKQGATLDILINNAGHLINKPFVNITNSEWQEVFQVNFFSNVHIINVLYPFFNREEGAHIVNIASMGGVLGSVKFPGLSAYSASKAALNSLTESLAVEFAGDNIHINAICPGAVQTPMLEKAFPEYQAKVSPEQMGSFIADFSLKSGRLMNGRIVPVSLEP